MFGYYRDVSRNVHKERCKRFGKVYNHSMVIHDVYMVYVAQSLEPFERGLMLFYVIESKLHVFCGKWFSIVPFHTFVKMERPRLAIVRHLPTVCKPGYYSTVLVFPGQRVESKAHSDITRSSRIESERRRISPVTSREITSEFYHFLVCRNSGYSTENTAHKY